MLNTAKNRLNSAKIDKKTAVEKQKFLGELHGKDGLICVTEGLKKGEKIDKILSQYEAGISKKSEESKPLMNGYNNGNNNANGSVSAAQQQVSFTTILNKQRTFFKPEYTKTTTSKIVEEAFRLATRSTG